MGGGANSVGRPQKGSNGEQCDRQRNGICTGELDVWFLTQAQVSRGGVQESAIGGDRKAKETEGTTRMVRGKTRWVES